MMRRKISIRLPLILLAITVLVGPLASAQSEPFEKVLDRTSRRVSEFLDQFSNVKCTEQVTQTKFKADGKVEVEQQSTYDYLVILVNSGGDDQPGGGRR